MDIAHDLAAWAESAKAANEHVSNIAVQVQMAPSSNVINAARDQIEQLNLVTDDMGTLNAIMGDMSIALVNEGEFTPEEANALIEASLLLELDLRGVEGALNYFSKHSIKQDIYLGSQRQEMLDAYQSCCAEVMKAVEIIGDIIGDLRQFIPPTESVKGELVLTGEIMDGFLEASNALLKDVKAGKNIEFV